MSARFEILRGALSRLQGLDGVRFEGGIGVGGVVATGEESTPELVGIALVLEYGDKRGRIPPRPFLKTAVNRNGRKWVRDIVPAARATIHGRDPVPYLRRTGLMMRADMQKTLRDGPWEPNAASTIKAKKSSMPLVDHGQLVNSFRVEIVAGEQREVVA